MSACEHEWRRASDGFRYCRECGSDYESWLEHELTGLRREVAEVCDVFASAAVAHAGHLPEFDRLGITLDQCRRAKALAEKCREGK